MGSLFKQLNGDITPTRLKEIEESSCTYEDSRLFKIMVVRNFLTETQGVYL